MESSSEGLSIHDGKKVLESLERRSFCCFWFPRLFSIGTNRDRFGFKKWARFHFITRVFGDSCGSGDSNLWEHRFRWYGCLESERRASRLLLLVRIAFHCLYNGESTGACEETGRLWFRYLNNRWEGGVTGRGKVSLMLWSLVSCELADVKWSVGTDLTITGFPYEYTSEWTQTLSPYVISLEIRILLIPLRRVESVLAW